MNELLGNYILGVQGCDDHKVTQTPDRGGTGRIQTSFTSDHWTSQSRRLWGVQVC